jgi:hypothetical protein
MKRMLMALAVLVTIPAIAMGADAPAKEKAKPARAAVDPAKDAEHRGEDVKRHRHMAAAHEAAAKCLESGREEDACNAELAKACRGIAYGKYCGMKHPD